MRLLPAYRQRPYGIGKSVLLPDVSRQIPVSRLQEGPIAVSRPGLRRARLRAALAATVPPRPTGFHHHLAGRDEDPKVNNRRLRPVLEPLGNRPAVLRVHKVKLAFLCGAARAD